MKLLDNIPSQNWIDARAKTLGGSEIAAALGKSPYLTPFQLWLLKTGRREPKGSTPITDMGHILEPVCAEKFTEMTGLKVRNISEPFKHPQHQFLQGNIDRQILSSEKHPTPGVLEIKTTTSFMLRNEVNEYPLSWEYQIQHYLMLTGYQYAYLQIMERDTGYFHDPIYIERNEELIAINTQKVIEWWQNHVIADVPPAPINDEDLLILYPNAKEGLTKEATPTLHFYYEQILRMRDRIEEYKAHKESLELKLKEELGKAEYLTIAGKRLLSWKNSTQLRFDTTRFKQEHPTLYKDFLKESTTRRFTINK